MLEELDWVDGDEWNREQVNVDLGLTVLGEGAAEVEDGCYNAASMIDLQNVVAFINSGDPDSLFGSDRCMQIVLLERGRL